MSKATNPEHPPTKQSEIKQSPHHGHQRADIRSISSQNTASKLTQKPPNRANSNTMDCMGQHNMVSKPSQTEKTEEL